MVDYGVVFEEEVDRWRWWDGYGGVGREASEIEAWRAMVHSMDCFARVGRRVTFAVQASRQFLCTARGHCSSNSPRGGDVCSPS